MNRKRRNQAVFISHGGGPLPLLNDPGHSELIESLTSIAQSLPKPKAVVLVSAHWEEHTPTITANASPNLIYDYYGFPSESYAIDYPAPGHPELAKAVSHTLFKAGLDPALSQTRGFDHGLFVPLKIMFPEADIPCIQVSLMDNLDPDQHIQLGEALAHVEEDFLLIGSGFSFHNLPAFFAEETPEQKQQALDFQMWLNEVCRSEALTEESRRRRLNNWQQAPGAHYSHPRAEHLMPLHVCYGFAGRPCNELATLKIMGKPASMMLWLD